MRRNRFQLEGEKGRHYVLKSYKIGKNRNREISQNIKKIKTETGIERHRALLLMKRGGDLEFVLLFSLRVP